MGRDGDLGGAAETAERLRQEVIRVVALLAARTGRKVP